MAEPRIRKFPTEVFGHVYSDQGKNAIESRKNQYCPYLECECKKPRKSQPKIKVGVCSLGYNVKDFGYVPVILCPGRFEVDEVFSEISRLYKFEESEDYDITWIPEVSMGCGGSVDYVLAKTSKKFGIPPIGDFICIEFQAGGTTGTPYDAVEELLSDGKYSKDSYDYGINWANEFIKTMMQQAYKKGKIVELWKENIVFVIQDIAMDYIKKNHDVSGLREATMDDPIHFFTLKMKWDDPTSTWLLEVAEILSTDSEGIRKILGGQVEEEYPSIDEFKTSIRTKMSRM